MKDCFNCKFDIHAQPAGTPKNLCYNPKQDELEIWKQPYNELCHGWESDQAPADRGRE